MSNPALYWLNETQSGMYQATVYNVVTFTPDGIDALLRRIEIYKQAHAQDGELLCMQFEDAAASFFGDGFDPADLSRLALATPDVFTHGRTVEDVFDDPAGGVFFTTPWWDDRPPHEEGRSVMVEVMLVNRGRGLHASAPCSGTRTTSSSPTGCASVICGGSTTGS
ncbi:MAG: hypothetical protein M5U28_13940 [Sandaracinaceae bacterium]|nr:hypothetical protein [Sandaracinaceae bacterium]